MHRNFLALRQVCTRKSNSRRVTAVCQASASHSVPQRSLLLQNIRDLKGAAQQRLWQPNLDPPAALQHFSVVLVSPKKPPNVGAVARACNCFEVEDLRIVDPACPFTVRSAQNAAMGGQRILWHAKEFSSVTDAIADCAYSIAFARWAADSSAKQHNFASVSEMMEHLRRLKLLSSRAHEHSDTEPDMGKVALVFGREVRGLTAEEVAACDAVCQIPMGRLQESLSLSHAVVIALCAAFERVRS